MAGPLATAHFVAVCPRNRCPTRNAGYCGHRWQNSPPFPIDDEVQEALAICGGDAIAALRITLIANAFLEAEVDRLSAAVSSGFARGKVRKAPKSKKAEEKETRIGTLLPAAHESGFGTKRTWVGKD